MCRVNYVSCLLNVIGISDLFMPIVHMVILCYLTCYTQNTFINPDGTPNNSTIYFLINALCYTLHVGLFINISLTSYTSYTFSANSTFDANSSNQIEPDIEGDGNSVLETDDEMDRSDDVVTQFLLPVQNVQENFGNVFNIS